jgi:hypothetical protein
MDTTPVLTPVSVSEVKEEVEGESEDDEKEAKEEADEEEGQEDSAVGTLCRLVAGMPENTIPPYIAEAAELISQALKFEADEQFEASLGAYRCALRRRSRTCMVFRAAIGKLLSCVQSDPDSVRQAQVAAPNPTPSKLEPLPILSFVPTFLTIVGPQVKRRIAQYIGKAEQIGKMFPS